MRTLSKIFFFILFSCWLFNASAGALKCNPVEFKIEGNNIVLPGTTDPKKSIVYFFQNKSLQSLWIDHPEQKNRGASAGWASYIRPNNWSAIVLTRKSFAISCSSIQPGKVETLNCAKSLAICIPQNMTTTAPLTGNYWLSEDKNWEHFIAAVQKRGVSFH